MTEFNYVQLGKAVIESEIDAIQQMAQRLNNSFSQACELCYQCQGKIIVTGMGKSGHIARKLAATFSSTGTPAFFVHPSEASHGDMGMITKQDVVIAISNSGETNELMSTLSYVKQMNIPLIVMTGKLDSTLAQHANIALDVSVETEACPLNLAPTSSTTACLVLSDALAIALLERRGFTKEDFAVFHPGGNIGRRLLISTNDIMQTGQNIPAVSPTATVAEALLESSRTNAGLTTIVDQNNTLLGVFTDGDLRRAINNNEDVYKTKVADCMNPSPITMRPNSLAAEVYQLMQEKKITCIVITDEQRHVLGIIQMHQLMLAGIR